MIAQSEFSFAPATASKTSRDAAKQITNKARMSRRQQFLLTLRAYPQGLALFQIAAILDVPEHWLTSTADHFLHTEDVERLDRTIKNPQSGKNVSVLRARPWVEK